jgi:hypothetical protein
MDHAIAIIRARRNLALQRAAWAITGQHPRVPLQTDSVRDCAS